MTAPLQSRGSDRTPFPGSPKVFSPEPGPMNAGERDLGQAISASLERLMVRFDGLKNLVEYFDGREGKAVAKSTVSQWMSDPGRFPAVFVPTLVELDPVFRSQVLRLLVARSVSQDDVVRAAAARSPEAGQITADAFEEVARRAWFGPGGMGERY